MALFTFADALDSLLAYLGGAPSEQVRRDCYQSIDEAIRELTNAHSWSYLFTHGRLNMHPPFTTGTINYLASDGAFPYQVALVGAAWPSWAADAYLRIGTVTYRVDQRVDASTLSLMPPLVPAEDLPAGTIYALYQDSYLLPADFAAQDQGLYEYAFGGMDYVHPRDWLRAGRYSYQVGMPRAYCIDGDPKYPGRLVARFSPIPSDARTVDFLYKRRPRPIVWQSYSTGTVALSPLSAVVTGAGTNWDQTMAGSILRTSPNSALPTWMPGGNVATFEGVIRSVTSPTSLVLQAAPTVTYAAAVYRISDPVDIEVGSMENAFLRCCEHKLSQHRIMKDKPSAKTQYIDELIRAKEADSRSFTGRAEGDDGGYRISMKDMPRGPDMS